MHERYNYIKDTLLCCVEAQLVDLKSADTEELGEVVDMIKDLEEAIYYETITKAMGEKESGTEPRDYDRGNGRMYYGGRMYYDGHGQNNSTGSSGHGNSDGRNYYRDIEMKYDKENGSRNTEYQMGSLNDYRNGKSYNGRRRYLEVKESHQDKITQMKELERYMVELSQDLTEMIESSPPEEKQYLKNKLNELATKINP